jgi:hypothetical protein
VAALIALGVVGSLWFPKPAAPEPPDQPDGSGGTKPSAIDT